MRGEKVSEVRSLSRAVVTFSWKVISSFFSFAPRGNARTSSSSVPVCVSNPLLSHSLSIPLYSRFLVTAAHYDITAAGLCDSDRKIQRPS